MTVFLRVSNAPPTHPVTILTTTGNRRTLAHVAPSWEATIWGTPQIYLRPLARRHS